MLANIESLIYSTLLFTPPLLIAGLGCNLTTTSGVVNIGIDGLMTVGAFIGCSTTYFFSNTLLGLICAGLASSIFSIVFAIFVLKFKTNEILVGFCLNIFMPAIIIIIAYALFNSTDTMALPSSLKIPILFKKLTNSNNQIIKFLSNIFTTYPTTYLAFILVFISHFLIYKTNFGLYVRACGANKLASIYVGIDKSKIQLICILISGFLYGISGAIYTMAITNQFRVSSICGQGYIALAAVLFSNANPFSILFYCVIFGFFSGLKVIIPANNYYVHLVQMLPYIAAIIIYIVKNRHEIVKLRRIHKKNKA